MHQYRVIRTRLIAITLLLSCAAISVEMQRIKMQPITIPPSPDG